MFESDLYRLNPMALDLSLQTVNLDHVSHKWSDYMKQYEIGATDVTTMISVNVPPLTDLHNSFFFFLLHINYIR